jgi:DNA-binding MarR family transcriptional regulator
LIEEEGPRPAIEPRAAQLLGALSLAVSDRMLEAMVASSGLSAPALATLRWIHRAPGLRASSLAEALGISSQGVGHLISRLEREGLLLRERDRWDGRAEKLRVSELGARQVALASRARAHVTRSVVDRLPWGLRPRLTRIAELVLGALSEEPRAALHGCRFCDWALCRTDPTAPCPVVLATASRAGTSRVHDPDVVPAHEDRVTIDGAEPPIELWLEPGEVAFRLDPGRRLEVVCRGPEHGRIDLERLPEGHVALYAWNHASFTVLEAGREIFVQERALSLEMGRGEAPRERVESLFGDFAQRRRTPPPRWR